MRRMRAMVDSYPGERVLIGETYVTKTARTEPLVRRRAAR